MIDQISEPQTDLELHQETNPISSPSLFIHIDSALQEGTSAHREPGEKGASDFSLYEEQEIEEPTEKQGSAINHILEAGSTAQKIDEEISNNSEVETDSSTKFSEKSAKAASDKLEETNSEEQAEENPLEIQSTDGANQLINSAAEEHSGTEPDTARRQITVSTTLAALPITTDPPTSEMDDKQLVSLA